MRRDLRPRDLRLMPFRGAEALARGILTRGQLRGPGWRRILPDIYVPANVTMDHRLWCVAATLYARGRGGVSGAGALRLLGLRTLERSPLGLPIEVTVPSGVRLRSLPQVVARQSILGPDDLTWLHETRCTSALRTAFDLGRGLPFMDAVIAVDAMAAARLIKIEELAVYATNRPGWRGLKQLWQVLAIAEPRTESPMETRTRIVLVNGGLPRPVAQFEVRDDQGRFVARLDLAYPQWKIGIEYDGDQHRDAMTFRADVARLNRLRLAGWTILRFTATDVFRKPEQMVAQVRAIIAEATRCRS